MSVDTKKLINLFDALADDFAEMLKDKTMTPADRKTLLQFLSDNNINCDGGLNPKVQNILDSLPFDDEEIHTTQ
jgi:hypothetical protein